MTTIYPGSPTTLWRDPRVSQNCPDVRRSLQVLYLAWTTQRCPFERHLPLFMPCTPDGTRRHRRSRVGSSSPPPTRSVPRPRVEGLEFGVPLQRARALGTVRFAGPASPPHLVPHHPTCDAALDAPHLSFGIDRLTGVYRYGVGQAANMRARGQPGSRQHAQRLRTGNRGKVGWGAGVHSHASLPPVDGSLVALRVA